MNGDTLSIEAPKDCSKKFAATFKRKFLTQQTRVYPYPLVAGSARPNPKMGAPDPENPLFLGFSVPRGGPRPWSRKGPDHGVGVDPETVTYQRKCSQNIPFVFRRCWGDSIEKVSPLK